MIAAGLSDASSLLRLWFSVVMCPVSSRFMPGLAASPISNILVLSAASKDMSISQLLRLSHCRLESRVLLMNDMPYIKQRTFSRLPVHPYTSRKFRGP